VGNWYDAGRTLDIAHRGASTAAPPNTLAAFEKAIELGADGIEFDVHLSADGVPVVIHDFTVNGTTNGSGRVASLTLVQLKQLDAGSYFDPAFAGERIPTLAEVLEAVGSRLLLNIELKSTSLRDNGLEQAVIAQVEQHDLGSRSPPISPWVCCMPLTCRYPCAALGWPPWSPTRRVTPSTQW